MNQSVIICSNCRTPNPARNLYCQSCGKPLIPAANPPAPGEVTQPSAAQPLGQGPVVAPTPGQPYAAPAGQPYPPGPEEPGETNAESEFATRPQQVYPPQETPPAYSAQPGQQPGAPPTYQVPPFSTPGAPQGYPTAQPQKDFFQQTQSKASSFFDQFRRQSFPVMTGSWSALVKGAGEKADEIEKGFVEDFEERDLAYVDLARAELTSGLVQRAYQVARHRAGSVTAYINPNGKDLMLGWELNVQQKPYWKMILILGAIALFIPFFISVVIGLNFWTFLILWFLGIAFFELAIFVGAAITGKIIKDDIWALFVEKPDPAALQELSALATAVQQSLLEAVKNAGLEAITQR